MKNSFSMLLVCILLSLTQSIFAQSNTPEKGESFIFYPVTDANKRDIPGFDCFYDAKLAINDGNKDNIKTKPKYRFKAGKNGYTPYSEIEGHYFVVRDYWKTNYDKIEKQVFYMTLVREDGEYILLRIPFVGRSSDNELTKSMIIIIQSKDYFLYGDSYYVNIPACNLEQFNSIKNEFYNDDFLPLNNYYEKGSAAETLHITAKNLTSFINPVISDDIYYDNKDFIHCDSITFTSVKGLAFKQPVVAGSYNNVNILIPAFEFRGKGSSSYGSQYCLSDLLTKKSIVKENELTRLGFSNYIGTPMVYEACNISSVSDYYVKNRSTRLEAFDLGTKNKYTLKDNEEYNCIDSRLILSGRSHHLNLIFEDKNGGQFEMSADAIYYGNRETINDHMVSVKRHQRHIKEKREIEQAKEEQIKAEEQAKQERLAELSRKYGKNNAKNIIEGHVKIGYTKQMCREAWGNPWEINYSTYSWGDYEQWSYKNNSYLYFKNGILTSFQIL